MARITPLADRSTPAAHLLDSLMAEVTSQDYDTVKATFAAALWLSANPERAYAWGQVLTEHTSPAEVTW